MRAREEPAHELVKLLVHNIAMGCQAGGSQLESGGQKVPRLKEGEDLSPPELSSRFGCRGVPLGPTLGEPSPEVFKFAVSAEEEPAEVEGVAVGAVEAVFLGAGRREQEPDERTNAGPARQARWAGSCR